MKFVLGVDEAGRGPLAGPVAVGVVSMPEGFDIAKEFPGVADSKVLSALKREKIFAMLESRSAIGDIRFVVEFSTAQQIDDLGITSAVSNALVRGVYMLAPTPKDTHIFLDGLLVAPPAYSQETVIHGDALIPIISLASIAAKVTRDRLMCDLANKYPFYSFEKHKGYGTKLHYDAIAKYGSCEIHRSSFLHPARY
jgi:ribonuclease HII